jgi:hypothetical protein
MREHVIPFLLLAFLAGPAFADAPPARAIDMTVVLTDIQGGPVWDRPQSEPGARKVTLGYAIATALLADHQGEQNLGAVEKAKRAALALRIVDEKAAVLTATEAADIVRLSNVLSAIVVLRVVQAVDPATDLKGR